MTSRQLYEGVLIELNKENAPNILLEDFNYFANKAINQYINKRYNIYDVNQQTTDDLRVLKATTVLTPQKSNDYEGLTTYNGNMATYYVNMPSDYLHLLNCICIYRLQKTYKCYNVGDSWRAPATRLTADMYSQVLDNFWNKPTYKKPYYYIHNVNSYTDVPTNPYGEYTTNTPTQGAPIQGAPIYNVPGATTGGETILPGDISDESHYGDMVDVNANLNIIPEQIQIDYDATSFTFKIQNKSTKVITWNAVSNADWITNISPNESISISGTNTTVTVSVNTNTSTYSRTGTITVTYGNRNKFITVTQGGNNGGSQGSQSEIIVSNISGSDNHRELTISNSSNESIQWSIINCPNWITPSSSGGTLLVNNTVTVEFTLDPNNSKQTRQGTVTIEIEGQNYQRTIYQSPSTQQKGTNDGTDCNVQYGNYGKDGNNNPIVQGEKIHQSIKIGGNDVSNVERGQGIRYGNVSKVRLEIRYGTDDSIFKLTDVYIDYIKTPQHIRLTQLEIDKTEDTSQMLEFPDYVCQEILNELVHIVMENISDQRLQTHPVVSQSIANPAQAQAPQAAQGQAAQ